METNAARIAAGRHPVIQSILGDVDIDLRVFEPWTRNIAPPVEKMSLHPYARINYS
jgi:hypothetical protein